MNDLKVCEKCGWHVGWRHSEECDPKSGEIARRLTRMLGAIGIQATQLGYGRGCVTAEFDEDHSVTFLINSDGTLYVNHFFWNDNLQESRAIRLAMALRLVLGGVLGG